MSVLNEKYNGIAIFSDRIPAESDYSTIYVGASNAFERYGNFAGLAETIDQGNKNRNDNAFVMADCTPRSDNMEGNRSLFTFAGVSTGRERTP